MVLTIWWLRHAPTHQKTFTGWRDVPADLSDVPQLKRVSQALPKGALVASSDLIRATATAAAIADGRDRLPADPRLREFNFGAWDGMTFSDVAARDPETSRAFWENPGAIRAPGGESWNELRQRADHYVEELHTGFDGHDIIAVAHMGLILTQIQMALDVTPAEALSHQIDPLSITRLRYSGGLWKVVSINHRP